MLEVVQYQEGSLLEEVGVQGVAHTLAFRFPQNQATWRWWEPRVRDPERCQVDEGYPVGEVAFGFVRRRRARRVLPTPPMPSSVTARPRSH